nr:f-box protein [Quercus suber]
MLKMDYEEVLKAVFPLLDGVDLASCMAVSKQWRDIARDDYFWKCVCAKRWPSICKRPNPPTLTFYKLYQTFYKRQNRRTLLPPRLSFDDLEFFIDIWTEGRLIFSEVVPGPVLQAGIKIPPPGICDMLRFHLEGPEYKMTLPVEPRFTVPICQPVSVSVLVGRKDSNRESGHGSLCFSWTMEMTVLLMFLGLKWISVMRQIPRMRFYGY